MENKSFEKTNFRAGLPRPTIFAASGLVLLAAIGLWVCSLMAVFLPSDQPMRITALVNIAYYLPFIVLPIVLYGLKNRGLSDALRLNPVPVFPMLSVALLAIISTLFAGILSALWAGFLNLIGLSSDVGTIVPSNSGELMRFVIIAAAIPAVCEELLFRGFVLSAWEVRGTKYAVIVSAILFSLMHGNIYGLPAYIFVGLVSGYLVFSLDSVYVGMIYHTVYNTACLVMNYLTFSQPAMEEAAASVAGTDIMGMVLAAALELIMGGVVIVMTLFTLKLRRKIMGIEPLPRTKQPLTLPERIMLVISLIPMIAMIFIQ